MSDNKPLLIALVVVGVLILGYVASLFLVEDEPKKSVVSQTVEIPADTSAPVTPTPEPEPEGEPLVVEPVISGEPEPPAFVLPQLDESDQLVRDGVVSLTRHEGINRWLGGNELIRKFVVLVDNVSNGSVPRQQVSFLAPATAFSAQQVTDELFVMDESTYGRYNLVTDVFTSVDSRRAAEFYVLLQPLFQRAYDELGYPNAKFEDAIFKAISRILEAPVITEPVKLVRPVVTYEYADPRLESLSAAQKQMVRMGPRNTRAIQAKLSEMTLELRGVLN